MSRHRNHVDRMRNEHGKMYDRARLAELIAANKRAPVTVYYLDSPTFIVYVPQRRRRKGGD